MDLGTLGRESALAGEDISLAQGMRDVDEIAIGKSADGASSE
jgi:hypothetical protein